MSKSVNQILQANPSSLKEKAKSCLLSELLSLFSFTEELVLTITRIQESTYTGKVKNEKYKKAFSHFYNRLPTLEIFTMDTDSEIIKEYLSLAVKYNLNKPVL